MIGAISLLMTNLTGADWEVSTENKKLARLSEEDEAEYLEYVKERYIECYNTNVNTYTRKQNILNKAFFPLVFGAIILVVLNLFGG